MENWCEISKACPLFVGKRLSEIGEMVMSDALSQEQQKIAAQALAAGWLEICGNYKNPYNQQETDKRLG